MDILLKSLRYDNFEIVNEVTAKVIDDGTNYICKLVPSNVILPYLETQHSLYTPMLYEVKHFYFKDLNKKLVNILRSGRKQYYTEHESIYLIKFEYIKGVPYFNYVIKNKQISIDNLHKLMYNTFNGLKDIHDAGYYHGDLGMESNIILEGSLESWSRAVIVDIEGGKITNQNQIDDDIETLAYMIWQIIVDDISGIEDKNGDVITSDHPKFIKLVKNNIDRFTDYSKYLKLLLWIFKTKPSTGNIIDRIIDL